MAWSQVGREVSWDVSDEDIEGSQGTVSKHKVQFPGKISCVSSPGLLQNTGGTVGCQFGGRQNIQEPQ